MYWNFKRNLLVLIFYLNIAGTGEIVQWLRAIAAFVEDAGSSPNTHMSVDNPS